MAKRLGWYLPEQLILKITLEGSSPKIWRRVEVHSGQTLEELHYVIQCVFMWQNSHLYHFLVPTEGKLTYAAMRAARRYHTMPPDPFFGGEESQDWPADEAMVGQVINPNQKQIVYEYDFGDSWRHIVKVEKRSPGGDPGHIPLCLAGENAAPFDDIGGIGGYYEWLDALQDDSHEMHEQAIEWLGADFDPTHFDLKQANKRLSEAFQAVPKKPKKPRKKKE